MIKLKPVNEQVAVIVGATSGIGRATALMFADAGAQVVVSGRSTEETESLAQEIRNLGGQATGIPAEVTDYAQLQNLADQAALTYGRIDTWVHAAAVSLYAPFEETTPDEFHRIIETNLLGQAYGAMVALPHLKKEGRGALIHITSVDAKRPLPLQSAYNASKKGVVGLLDTLRLELQQEKAQISVTNIIPASVNTPFYEKAETKLGVKPQPIPPIYEPELVADAILYAAQHPVRELYVGGAGRGLSLMQRLSPALADRAARKLGFGMEYSDEPRAADAPSNLFGHLDGYDTVKGNYSNKAKSKSFSTWYQTHPLVRWGITASALALTAAAVGGMSYVAGRAVIKRRRAIKWSYKATRLLMKLL